MAVWENVIGYGLHADRPAAGAPGALYCESDSGHVYRDNGTSWTLVAAISSPRRVESIIADTTLLSANVLCIVTGGTFNVTLPDPVANAGAQVTVKGGLGGAFAVKNPDGSGADASTQMPWNGISDGVQWWNVDF